MGRSGRVIGLGLLLVVATAVGCVLAAWLALRGSLPQYSGEIRSSALASPVTVERDALGTVTLQAGNRHDVAWALGFVHAQERFFEMDLLRRRSAGELAELFGSVAIAADRSARAHRMRARMKIEFAAMPSSQRDEINAYRDGVNAGLASLRVRPLAYLLTRSAATPWQSEDTLLAVAAMAFTLNDFRNKRELAFSQMHAALPVAAFRFLTASGGDWDAPLVGAPLQWPQPPDADTLDMRTLGLKNPVVASAFGSADDRFPGSNAFSVNGALAGGAALIANDMHLDLRVPNIWFRTRILYPDPRNPDGRVDISGASLPGTPALVVGSNGHVAWGFTNSTIDTTDWVRVVLDADDIQRYRTSDGWATISKHTELIKVHGSDAVALEVEETRWGPILAKDADGTPLALAWTAQQPGSINLQLQQMELARTVDEGVAIAQASGIPPQNLLIGDRHGNIAWTIAGRVPRRIGGYDPALPADWSQPGTGWDGWLDASEVPLVANPPWQRIWSGNQRMVEGAALAILGDGGYDLGARARQIRDDLKARDRFTPSEMLDIQLDDRALFLERWKDLLQLELHRAPDSPLKSAMQTALADWSGRAAIDSVAYRLVRAWRNEVVDKVMLGFAEVVRQKFPDFTWPKMPQAEQAVWMLINQRPAHLLPPGHADWDALLIACADRAGGQLDAQPGGLAARNWGERNTAHIAHPLSRALPAFAARWLDMPADPLPGDSNMPRVQSPDFGASERFAVAPGDETNGYFMMPGGQSGHPLSPYYGAGHEDWVEGKPTPFLPGPPQQTLTLRPQE